MRHFASVEGLIAIDRVAQRYGSRPSALTGVTDPYLAWCVDDAAALAGLLRDAQIARQARQEAAAAPPPPPPRQVSTPFGGLLTGAFSRET